MKKAISILLVILTFALISAQTVGEKGFTELMKAARTNQFTDASKLIAEKKDINAADDAGWTALMWAA